MKDTLATLGLLTLCAGYTLGPIFGLYAAVTNGSFFHAVASIAVPWWGMIYFILS